jgi:hypothetical protein
MPEPYIITRDALVDAVNEFIRGERESLLDLIPPPDPSITRVYLERKIGRPDWTCPKQVATITDEATGEIWEIFIRE